MLCEIFSICASNDCYDHYTSWYGESQRTLAPNRLAGTLIHEANRSVRYQIATRMTCPALGQIPVFVSNASQACDHGAQSEQPADAVLVAIVTSYRLGAGDLQCSGVAALAVCSLGKRTSKCIAIRNYLHIFSNSCNRSPFECCCRRLVHGQPCHPQHDIRWDDICAIGIRAWCLAS